jgi:starch-binding outer membrane protein, SusD/RagB family
MKKYFKRIKSLMLTASLTAVLLSCSESFLEKSPQDQPNPGNFFVNETSAQNANSAIYNFWLREARLHGRDLWIILDAMTDDANWRSNRAESIQQEKWDIYPTHVPMVNYWTYIYRSINAANFSIEGIPNSTDLGFTDDKRIQYIAEARFMRGYNYLFLTTLYGDIPLTLKTLNNFTEYDQPKATQAEVYAAVIEDLNFAKSNLPAAWPASYKGRPTRAAAAAYLAQVYLFMEQYANAEAAAREAITIAEGDGYALVADYQSIFKEATEDNAETIFKFEYVKNSPDAGTNLTVQINVNPSENEFKNILGEAWMYSLPQRSLYDEYEPDDKRRGYTIYAPGDFYGLYQSAEKKFTLRDYNDLGQLVSYQRTIKPGDSVFFQYYWSQTGLGTKKMATDLKDLTNVRWSGKDVPLMRMAELYLFLAEALAAQGKAEALDWINKVRARPSVNLPPRTVGDGRKGDTDLVSILRHERRVELAMECKRLFDILRWKQLGEIFQGENVKRHFYWMHLNSTSDPKASPAVMYDQPAIQLPKHYRFPIPQTELDLNSLIDENNPGY